MSYTLLDIQRTYRTYRLSILCELLLLIGAVAMYFISRSFILPILAIAVVLHLALSRPLQKTYTRMFNQTNIQHTVCPALSAKSVAEKEPQAVTEEQIRSANLMPCDSDSFSLLLRWQIRGQSKKLKLALCDAVIPQRFRLKARGKKRVHFNSGVWVHIELPVDTGLNFRLLDATSVPTPIRMDYFSQKPTYATASLSDPLLAERCVLYAKNALPGSAMQAVRPSELSNESNDPVIPGGFLRRYKQLLEYTPGYVAVSAQGSSLDVFIRGRFLARPVTLKEKPTQALLEFHPFPELSYVIDLANAMLP